LPGIERGQLQRFAILNVADADVIVEVNRARRAGGDALDLNAGAGKHQHLRVGGNAQFLEQSR
jgi:hypothetical protein